MTMFNDFKEIIAQVFSKAQERMRVEIEKKLLQAPGMLIFKIQRLSLWSQEKFFSVTDVKVSLLYLEILIFV